jgi:molecular chaperone GrpE (heat shock protein)
MGNKMKLDERILNEIKRHHSINKYILEQDAELDLGAMAPPAGGVADAPPPSDQAQTPPPPPGGDMAPDASAEPEVIDPETDDEVEKVDNSGESEEMEGTEELDITQLVDSQKSIEQKQEEYFNNLFSQLSNLESKLSEMDSIVSKLNQLENKIEKYREKTPEEKLELRSYDSYPFNQKLSDFFDDKKEEMEISGKNDYILTSDEVTNINQSEIKNSFHSPPDM